MCIQSCFFFLFAEIIYGGIRHAQERNMGYVKGRIAILLINLMQMSKTDATQNLEESVSFHLCKEYLVSTYLNLTFAFSISFLDAKYSYPLAILCNIMYIEIYS